jgi:hypothetical protein
MADRQEQRHGQLIARGARPAYRVTTGHDGR